MIDIQIVNDTHVRMQKMMWHPSELLLAQCYGFSICDNNQIITAEIKSTAKRALFEFIKLSFKNFSESLAEQPRRDAFYVHLDSLYAAASLYVTRIMEACLPYYPKFFTHQSEGVQEAYYKKANFLAYEMGLGKTITAASLSRVWQIPRTVVICPAAVKFNWYRDLTDKFGFNPIYFTMLDSSKKRTFRALMERFVICNYDIVDKFEEIIASSEVGHFIFDEAHYLKNHLTGRTKAVSSLVEKFPDAKITFLSGTPIANRVNDIFSYLKLVGHELGHNHKKFLDEYTIQTKNRSVDRVTGGKNLQDLHLKLANFMIRKTKEECLDLPDKVYLSYRYELDDYKAEYNKIIDELGKQKSISALSSNLHSLNIVTSKAKLKGIVEIANTIIAEGRKVVIFGGYKEPLNTLEQMFGKQCVKIDGSVESYMRDQLVQQFINDPECKVFLGNYDAAGVGINLVNASDVIFINFPFTPAKLYQAIDRCHRIGQDRSVNIHYTFCDESIDQYIYDIIIDKEEDINAVIDQGKEVVLRENTIEILIKKLLHRDDIVFKNNFSKDHGTAPGEEAIEIKEPEEALPPTVSSIDTGVLPVPGEAKYYLVLLTEINTMAIYNENEYQYTKLGPREVLFSHEDHTEVIKQLRHKRLTFTGHATEKYTPNAPLDVSGKITIIPNGAIIRNTPEQTQKLSEIVSVLTPPPGFL